METRSSVTRVIRPAAFFVPSAFTAGIGLSSGHVGRLCLFTKASSIILLVHPESSKAVERIVFSCGGEVLKPHW